MRVGDLVRTTKEFRKLRIDRPGPESGVLIRNHHPKRRPDTSQVFDVLWDTGEVFPGHAIDLEVIAEVDWWPNESR